MTIRKAKSLKDQAYKSILESITSGQMERGQLYSENWFAEHLEISRTPVREALLQLRSEGLIEIRANRGVMVRELTEKDAHDLMQMRSAIESYCSAYMAEHYREARAQASIEKICFALERCHENFNQADEMFIHEEIIDFTKNPLFREQFDRFRTMIDIFWWDIIKDAENRREEVYLEHKAIIESIASGDANAAQQASMNHSHITLEKICVAKQFTKE